MARFDVIIATTEFPPCIVGGLGIYVTALVTSLVEDGLDVAVLCPQFPGFNADEREWLTDGSCIYRIPVSTRYAYSEEMIAELLAESERLFGEGELEAPTVHVHEAHLLPLGEAARERFGAKLVFTVHLSQTQRRHYVEPGSRLAVDQGRIDELERRAMESADEIIAVSRYMKEMLAGAYQVSPGKITPVYYPGERILEDDNLELLPDPERAALRAKLARDDEPLVLFVGRPSPQKGLHDYLRAVTSDRIRRLRVRALVIGSAKQVSTLYRTVAPARAGNLIPIPFLDWEELSRFYQVADVGVMPSLAEPFGIVALEMIACGLPMVYSDVDGLGEILGPLARQTPCLEPVRVRGDGLRSIDDAELVDAIDRLLGRLTPEARARYAELGRQYISERFSVDEFVDVHRAAYA